MNLIDLRCVSADDLKGWLYWARRVPADQRRDSMVDDFCADAERPWCLERIVEGRCIREKPTKQHRKVVALNRQ